MITTCEMAFYDDTLTYNITLCDENYNYNRFTGIKELLSFCKEQDITQIFFYNGKIDFSYFDYYVLTNDWKREAPAKPGVLRRNTYKTIMSENGTRYSMLLGLGNGQSVRLRNLSLLAKGGLDIACRDFEVDKEEETSGTIMNLLMSLTDSFLELADVDIICDKYYTIGAIAKKYQLYLMETTNKKKFYEVYKMDTDRNKDLLTQNIVRGGVCWYNERYLGQTLGDCYKYDYNSSYPYIMRNYPMPAGKFTASRTIPKDDKLHFILMRDFRATLKPNRVPVHSDIITGDNLPIISYYPEDNFWIWEDELKALERYYDLQYTVKVCWSFDKFYDAGMAAYVDKFYALKSESRGAKRTCIKLLLNSIYGKFGENVYRNIVYYELQDGIAHKVVEKVDHTNNDTLRYLSIIVSSYIASMGRARIMNETLDICGDRICEDFVYCDTDCIVLRGFHSVQTSDTALGAFKNEGHFTAFKVLAKKTYIGYSKGKLITVHAPGVDNHTLVKYYSQLNEEEGTQAFNNETKFECPIYVIKAGGVVLQTTPRKLADVDALRTNGILFKE